MITTLSQRKKNCRSLSNYYLTINVINRLCLTLTDVMAATHKKVNGNISKKILRRDFRSLEFMKSP